METVNNRNDLTTGVVWKKLILFFVPIAAGTFIQQLYNAVDGMIVGKFVGTVALAAVGGSSTQIINVLIGFFVAMTSGAAVVIAQIFGAGKREDVQKASGTAIGICIVLGLALALLGIVLAEPMLRLLKTPDDTIPGSVLYLRIYFAGVPFVLVLNMESNMLRSVGDSVSPFVFMVTGCIANIILDTVFVLVFGWGIAGVAIATVAAQVLNMLLLTGKLTKPDCPYRLRLGNLRLSRRYLGNMMRIGIPSGLQSSMYSVSNTIIQVGVNSLGTVVVASWAMTGKADGIYWAASNALGAAITTFIGQNMGAGKTDRVKQCVRQGLLIAVIMTALLCALIMLLAKPFLGILTDDAAVRTTTFEMMTYFVPYYIIWTLIEVLSGALRGAGDAVNPVIIIGLGICLFRVIWIATVFTSFTTLPVLCFAYPASWLVTGIALFIYYRRGNWLERSTSRISGKY